MKVLVIGSNGREHALAEKYSDSKKVSSVFIAPGNGLSDFTNKKIKNIQINIDNISEIIDYAKKNKIDLVDVAQDDYIAKGYVDLLTKEGINTFGPAKNAAILEYDKKWAREFMLKYNLPVPLFKSFDNTKKAISYINSLPNQTLYIKASGLAKGKGAIRAENKRQSIQAIYKMKDFGESGKTFLVEEALIGEEFSLFAITDGENYILTKACQDHKTIYNKDLGPNTGGMGTVYPSTVLTHKDIKIIEQKIIKPTIKAMSAEKRTYKGILYLGGIITKKGPKIIEFNARWGDPETEVILPGIKTDYFEIATAVIKGKINKINIEFDNRTRISVAGCSFGYPYDTAHVNGKEIFGIQEALSSKDIQIYGSGIKRKGNKFFANGGRIFHVVSSGINIFDARQKAYNAIAKIYIQGNNLHYRTDIGSKDLNRLLQ